MAGKKPDPVSANLTIWEALRTPDVEATKPFQRSGGFRGTQIDPTWRLKIMTEYFGPVGTGWGYVEDAVMVEHGMVFSKVRVWYVMPPEKPEFGVHPWPNNARWTGPQWGGTEIAPERGGKPKPSDECFKMSITDALGKCLLQLGVGADIYMGLFDDSKYRDDVAANQQEDKRQASAAQYQKVADEILAEVEKCTSNAAIDDLLKLNARAIKDMKDNAPGVLTRLKAEVEKIRKLHDNPDAE